MAHCLIALGSNLGDRGAQLTAARDQLAALPQSALLKVSSFRDSKPAGGPPAQPPYLNAAATLETALSPQQLLHELQRIENDLGRERIERWGPRTIDLDLLLYDQLELESPELTLPHPRMSFRRFVLEPAAEIAGEMAHPINGWTVGRLLANLKGKVRMIALAIDPKWNDDAGTELLRSISESARVLPWSYRYPECRNIAEFTQAIDWVVVDFWMPSFLFPEQSPKWPQVEIMSPTLLIAWHPVDTVLFALDRARRDVECPPCLWIPGTPLEQATQEVIAAMAAME